MSARWFAVQLSALLALGAPVATGCGDELAGSGDTVRGSGTIATEVREVGDFDRVDLLTSGEVTIEVGGPPSLTVEGDDNILPLLNTIVMGERLALDVGRNTTISPSQEIEYRITVPSLQGIEIFGSGRVIGSGIDGEAVEVTILGSGDVDIVGGAELLTVRIPGSGKVDAGGLATTTASVAINGSGSALVNASDRLDVTINGSGSVSYLGTPVITEEINGSGDVAPA